MSTHTPGPWRQGTHAKQLVTSDSGSICKTLDAEVGIEAAESNAAAISALPELVAALRAVQTDMQRSDFKSEADRCAYVLGYVRAALAKAGA